MTDPLEAVGRVALLADRLIVTLRRDTANPSGSDPQRLILPFRLVTGGGRNAIVPGATDGPRRDLALIRALRRAHAMLGMDRCNTPVLDKAPPTRRSRRILRLAFLAPDIQRAILEGRQPRHMTLAGLIDVDIPLLWSEPRRLIAASG